MIKKIENISKKYHHPEFLCHVQFVRKIALELQKKHGGNKKVIEIAALLHDIGRGNERGNEDHADAGARLAEMELEKLGLRKELVKDVKNCILSHNMKAKQPETIEEKIIATADAASVIKYPAAFIMLSNKPIKMRAEWFLRKIEKDFKRIQFEDYKNLLREGFEELKKSLEMIMNSG